MQTTTTAVIPGIGKAFALALLIESCIVKIHGRDAVITDVVHLKSYWYKVHARFV